MKKYGGGPKGDPVKCVAVRNCREKNYNYAKKLQLNDNFGKMWRNTGEARKVTLLSALRYGIAAKKITIK